MSKVKKFYKTTMVYFLGRMSSSIITFALLPIYTSKITTDNYGYYDYVISLLALLVPVLFFEMWSGVLRLSFDSEEEEYKNKIISTGFLTICIPMLVFVVGFLIFTGVYSIQNQWLIFVYVIAWVLNLFLGSVARSLQANFVFATSGIVGSVSNGLVGLVCVYIFNMQSSALFLAMIGSYVMQNLYIIFSLKLWKRLKIKLFDIVLSKKIFIFCIPFAVTTIAHYLQTNYSKVLINKYLSMDMVAIFSVAGKFMVVVSLLASIFHLAWQETTFSMSNDEGKARFYNIGLNAFLTLTVWGCVLLLPAVKIVFPFMIGEDYRAAGDLIPIYYIAILTTTMSGFLTNILTAEKATTKLIFGKAIGCVFNLGIIYAFIQSIGIWAVIFGYVVGTGVELLVGYIMVRRVVDIHFELKPFIMFIIFYGGSMILFAKGNILVNCIWLLVCGIVAAISILKIFKFLKENQI